jgi:hypothetical protein
MSFFLILYLVKCKPFELDRDNKIEIVNELTIMFSFYSSLGVITDDSTTSVELKYYFGFCMIALVLLNVVFNFSIFIGNLLMQLGLNLREAYLRFRAR